VYKLLCSRHTVHEDCVLNINLLVLWSCLFSKLLTWSCYILHLRVNGCYQLMVPRQEHGIWATYLSSFFVFYLHPSLFGWHPFKRTIEFFPPPPPTTAVFRSPPVPLCCSTSLTYLSPPRHHQSASLQPFKHATCYNCLVCFLSEEHNNRSTYLTRNWILYRKISHTIRMGVLQQDSSLLVISESPNVTWHLTKEMIVHHRAFSLPKLCTEVYAACHHFCSIYCLLFSRPWEWYMLSWYDSFGQLAFLFGGKHFKFLPVEQLVFIL
jgi:hypothetical protein